MARLVGSHSLLALSLLWHSIPTNVTAWRSAAQLGVTNTMLGPSYAAAVPRLDKLPWRRARQVIRRVHSSVVRRPTGSGKRDMPQHRPLRFRKIARQRVVVM